MTNLRFLIHIFGIEPSPAAGFFNRSCSCWTADGALRRAAGEENSRCGDLDCVRSLTIRSMPSSRAVVVVSSRCSVARMDASVSSGISTVFGFAFFLAALAALLSSFALVSSSGSGLGPAISHSTYTAALTHSTQPCTTHTALNHSAIPHTALAIQIFTALSHATIAHTAHTHLLTMPLSALSLSGSHLVLAPLSRRSR